MPYIGTQPLTGQFKKLDAITVVNGQAAYTMQYNSSNYKPATANALLVSVNGVIQAAEDAYTISGSTITFTENLVTGDTIDFIIALGDTGSAVTPVDGSVTTAKLANDAVTSDKLAHDLTVQTSLSVPTIKDSSGTNTAMTIDSSGRVAQPQKPAWHAFKDNGTVTGAETDIIWNKTKVNRGTIYSTTTGQVTIPVAGVYFIYMFGITPKTAAEDLIWFELMHNNSAVVGFNPYGEFATGSDGHMNVSGQIMLDLSVNDTLDVRLGNNSAAGMWAAGGNAHNGFGGYLVG